MSHVARRILRSAAAAGIVSLAAACIVPPPGVAPRPNEAALAAPDVAFSSLDSDVNIGSGTLAYSTTRDAYTAAFEVDQRGQVRVLAPASPRDAERTRAGTSYILQPMLRSVDREYLSPSTDFSRVPFVFVLTSDTPLNLTPFGTGREWTHAMTIDTRNPDSTIARVAEWVLPDAPAYGSDYAYVGPELRGAEREFVSSCARPVEDVHDYGYYRDLWAVFTPADQRLSVNPYWLYSPAISWSSYSLLPLVAYRAQLASSAFYTGCAGDPYAYGAGSYYAYTPYAGYGYDNGYGFGYGLGYPIGYGVVLGQGRPVPAPKLHVPVTPNGLGSMQVAGTSGSNGTTRTAARPFGVALAWRPFELGHTPGEVQTTPRVTLGERLPSYVAPADRRGGQQPWAHAITRTPGTGGNVATGYGRSGGNAGGHATASSSASRSSSSSGGSSAGRSANASSSSGGSSTGSSSGSSGGARGGRAQ